MTSIDTVVIGAGHAGQSGVDDGADPGDRQAALGDRRRQDHPAPRTLLQGGVLDGGRQPSVQRHHVEVAQPTRDPRR